MKHVDPNIAFVFANALELSISISAALLLLHYVIGKIDSWSDFKGRVAKLFRRDFQGGPYDLAIAIMVIFVGRSFRTQAAWEWRFFDNGLPVGRMFIGLVMSTIGALCLIRILSPHDRYNCYITVVLVISMLFAIWSVMV